jgi:hypothetical protein
MPSPSRLEENMHSPIMLTSARLRSYLLLLLALPLVTSCIASNQTGPYRPVSIAEDVDSIRWVAYPGDLSAFYTLSPVSQASARNQMVTARMYIIDLEYHYYEARLTRELQDEGLLATAANLGLTGTAALIPVAQTSRLLAGIATGVTGLDKAYTEKELLSNTIQALQMQMRADRKSRAADIQSKMAKPDKTPTPIDEYPLAMALSDVDSYYQAGTLASALLGLQKTVSIAEANATQAKADSGPNPVAVSQAITTSNPVTTQPAVPTKRPVNATVTVVPTKITPTIVPAKITPAPAGNVRVTPSPQAPPGPKCDEISDDAGAVLTNYLYPNGKFSARDAKAAKTISDFIKEQNIAGGKSIVSFLDCTDQAANRVTLARRLKLIP